MTGIAPVMWSVWGAIVILFILVKVVFLGDAMQQEKSAQAAIAAKVDRIEPVRKAVLGLLGIATLFVIGYYAFDVYRQFRP